MCSGHYTKKLEGIKSSWNQHRSIKDVMIFLQEYGSALYLRQRYLKPMVIKP